MVLQLFQEDAGQDEGVVFEWELKDDAPIDEIRQAIGKFLVEHGALVRAWSPIDGYIY